MSTPPPDIRFGCGCLVESMIINGESTMVITACAKGESCQVVQIALDETAAQNKPSTVIGGTS